MQFYDLIHFIGPNLKALAGLKDGSTLLHLQRQTGKLHVSPFLTSKVIETICSNGSSLLCLWSVIWLFLEHLWHFSKDKIQSRGRGFIWRLGWLAVHVGKVNIKQSRITNPALGFTSFSHCRFAITTSSKEHLCRPPHPHPPSTNHKDAVIKEQLWFRCFAGFAEVAANVATLNS